MDADLLADGDWDGPPVSPFVAVESALFLGSELRAYQAIGAPLVVGRVFAVSCFRDRELQPSEVHH